MAGDNDKWEANYNKCSSRVCSFHNNMFPKNTAEREFDESDALHYESIDAKAKESSSLDDSLSNVRSEATKGYIDKFPYITWTLVAAIGIALCLIHSHQDSLWQWTGDTAADAQSLQAKVVVSVFSAVIGGCLVAVLSKALVSVSLVMFRYRGASFSYMATVIEGYAPSRILTLFVGRQWVSMMLIVLILVISVVTKQIAVVSMGVEFMATNNTKVSYTRNYTNCKATFGASAAVGYQVSVTAQTFNALLIPNSSYTNETYDSSIPSELVGSSRFERVLPYAKASCVQFDSDIDFGYQIPITNSSGYTWRANITLPASGTPNGTWINCTLIAGYSNAISTCIDTKCETVPTSDDLTAYLEKGNGIAIYLQSLFRNYASQASRTQNLVTTWLLGGDILKKSYTISDPPPPSTTEAIANRVATLGTVLARTICDLNFSFNNDVEENKIPATPITSNYIDHYYYQYKILWRWPFYVLAGCIFALWLLCMVAMWLAPESRVLSIDWLLNQYISRHQYGYLSGADLLPAHRGARYQVYDDNANGDVGNIVISRAESHKLDKYNRVIQDKQYQ
ncbi:hypothetical protein MUCCIDRAFT_112595 [Mucor lusitanicus CBS 277.49]|uniref:Uncharacterized protein n=1 Tax=Mucor lusitanicus CBS 277.49 TaxID=747725 RepID=A0A168JGJ4_MUCCL|nr:hypothetical protein MUCCIDRAFT_112595 [Mucor lusitanicus CBS 277.49]